MPFSEHEQLLHDVLLEGDYPQFRKTLLRQTAAEFRRCHQRRNAWLAWGLAASLAIGLSLWQLLNLGHPLPQVAPTPPRARAIEPSWVVRTSAHSLSVIRSIASTDLIVRTRLSPLAVVTSDSAERFTVLSKPCDNLTIATSAANKIQFLKDAELCQLFPDQPVGFALSKDGHRQFFVFGETPQPEP